VGKCEVLIIVRSLSLLAYGQTIGAKIGLKKFHPRIKPTGTFLYYHNS